MTNEPQKVKKPSPRTLRQNAAMHKYFAMIAEELNNAGYNVQTVLKQKLEVDWNPMLVKEILWRSAQIAILRKKSTKELTKSGEIDLVYEHLTRHLGEKFGVFVEFPHFEPGEYEKVTASV